MSSLSDVGQPVTFHRDLREGDQHLEAPHRIQEHTQAQRQTGFHLCPPGRTQG